MKEEKNMDEIMKEDISECFFLIPGVAVNELLDLLNERLTEKEQARLGNLLGVSVTLANRCIHEEKLELLKYEYKSIDSVNTIIEQLKEV